MRLIDADALIIKLDAELMDISDYLNIHEQIKDIIDNAPTVNPCENCDLYFKAMTKEEMKKGGAENE